MGHIVNSIGLRVGWIMNWSDSWYSNFIYYPELLHQIYRIRLYLYYFFSIKIMDKFSFLLSQIFIGVQPCSLIVRLFVYDSHFLESFFRFVRDLKRFFFFKLRLRSYNILNKYKHGLNLRRFKRSNFMNRLNNRNRFFKFGKNKNFRLKRLSLQTFYNKNFKNFSLKLHRFYSEKSAFIRQNLKFGSVNSTKDYKSVSLNLKNTEKLIYCKFCYNKFLCKKRDWLDVCDSKLFPICRYIPRSHQIIDIASETTSFDVVKFRRNKVVYRINRNFNKIQEVKLAVIEKKKSINFIKSVFPKIKFVLRHLYNKDVLKINDSIGRGVFIFFLFIFNFKFFLRKDYIYLERVFLKNLAIWFSEFKLSYIFRLLNSIFFFNYRKFLKLRLKFKPFNKIFVKNLRKKFVVNLSHRLGMKFFFIYLILFKFIHSFVKGRLIKVKSLKLNLRSFLFEYSSLFILLFFDSGNARFSFFSRFFSCILNLFCLGFNIKFEIFFISNVSVSANFLSSYMAKRLIQGYSLNEVLNPIKRHLSSMIGLKTHYYIFKYNNNSFKYSTKLIFIKSFILKYMYIYKYIFLREFFAKKTWFNSYVLWFLNWFKRQNFIKKFNKNNKKFMKFFIGFSKNFILRKSVFLIFFNFDFSVFLYKVEFLFKEVFFFNLFKVDIFRFFSYFNLFDEMFSTYNLIINYNLFYFGYLKIIDFLLANTIFNRLFRYFLWKYSYGWLMALNNKNNFNVRKENYLSSSNFVLLGYRFFLRGRFSRKQRASSFFFNKGFIPLNSISVPIDYSFTTAALHNSAVSVKIWLYKNRLAPGWFMKSF